MEEVLVRAVELVDLLAPNLEGNIADCTSPVLLYIFLPLASRLAVEVRHLEASVSGGFLDVFQISLGTTNATVRQALATGKASYQAEDPAEYHRWNKAEPAKR